MDKAADRSAKLGEIRVMLDGGVTLRTALARTGVAEATYRRWKADFDRGGIDALKDKPKSGRPPSVTLNEEEVACLRRVYMRSNRTERTGSMTMAARMAALDPDTPLTKATRDAILKKRASKHELPVEIRRAFRGVPDSAVMRYRDGNHGITNGIYIPGWLRRDEETGRMLLPGERQVWDDASVNMPVVVPWTGAKGDRCAERFGVRLARFQLLMGIDCATDFPVGFGYVMRTSDGYRACDVVSTLHRVWGMAGYMPRQCVMEGGSWQAKATLDFLRTAGVRVVSAKGRPNQKLVEGFFNRLWTALSITMPAFGQIGRYRGEMAKEKLEWMAAQRGERDPRGRFPSLKTFLESLGKALDYLRWETVESRQYGKWSPQEAYKGAAANGLPLPKGLERYALPVCETRRIRRDGMVFVTAETKFEGYRHEYVFASSNGWMFDGAAVKVRFDPMTAAERGAVLELAERWKDFPAGTLVDGAAKCVSPAPDFEGGAGFFDFRGEGRKVHNAGRAAVRAVVAAYDERGVVASAHSLDGEVDSVALGTAAPPAAAEEPKSEMLDLDAIEAEERMMAFA